MTKVLLVRRVNGYWRTIKGKAFPMDEVAKADKGSEPFEAVAVVDLKEEIDAMIEDIEVWEKTEKTLGTLSKTDIFLIDNLIKLKRRLGI